MKSQNLPTSLTTSLRNRILPVVAGMLLTYFAFGQKTITTLSTQVSFPQQEYRKTYPVTGFGLRWSVLHRPSQDIPLSIGGEAGLLVTGSDSKYLDLYYMGFYDRYRISADNNIVSLAFKVRVDLQPADKPVQIFIDGTLGTNIFFSSVTAERQTFSGSNQYGGGSSTKAYWAIIGGPGVGIEIPLGKTREFSLAFKTTYLFGSHTKYLTNPHIDNNGNVFFTERQSRTDMILAEAGVKLGIFTKRSKRHQEK